MQHRTHCTCLALHCPSFRSNFVQKGFVLVGLCSDGLSWYRRLSRLSEQSVCSRPCSTSYSQSHPSPAVKNTMSTSFIVPRWRSATAKGRQRQTSRSNGNGQLSNRIVDIVRPSRTMCVDLRSKFHGTL